MKQSVFWRYILLPALCGYAANWIFAPAISAREFERSMQVQNFYSPAVERTLKYAVMLPSGYHNSQTAFPVLYLLHGHSGNYRSWINYAQLPLTVANQLNAVVVLVDGGNSFYVNWYAHQESKPQRWEDMVVQDLVAHVDQHYRTQSTRSGRYIGGLSMGGYGAVTLALRHPQMFSFAFSSAGALAFARHAADELQTGKPDWNQPELWSTEQKPPVDIKGFATQRERTPRGTVFSSEEQANAHDPIQLIKRLSSDQAPYLHFDVGTDDALADETRQLVDALRANRFAYSYTELPGTHELPYWRQAMLHTIVALQRHQLSLIDASSK
jgi:putative tributyrin esterase